MENNVAVTGTIMLSQQELQNVHQRHDYGFANYSNDTLVKPEKAMNDILSHFIEQELC